MDTQFFESFILKLQEKIELLEGERADLGIRMGADPATAAALSCDRWDTSKAPLSEDFIQFKLLSSRIATLQDVVSSYYALVQ